MKTELHNTGGQIRFWCYQSLLVHHLVNKKGSLVGTKSLVHFFKGGGL